MFISTELIHPSFAVLSGFVFIWNNNIVILRAQLFRKKQVPPPSQITTPLLSPKISTCHRHHYIQAFMVSALFLGFKFQLWIKDETLSSAVHCCKGYQGKLCLIVYLKKYVWNYCNLKLTLKMHTHLLTLAVT